MRNSRYRRFILDKNDETSYDFFVVIVSFVRYLTKERCGIVNFKRQTDSVFPFLNVFSFLNERFGIV